MDNYKDIINLYIYKSNTDIAKIICKEHNLDLSNVDRLRKKISLYKKRIYNLEFENIELKDTITKNIFVEEVNTLVIGDLHEPYTHKDYFDFCLTLSKDYNCKKIVFIGDIIDNHSISYHEKNPNLSNPSEELEKSKISLIKWYNAFPNAYVTNGNHDLLFTRKINSAGLPLNIVKSLKEILGLDNWKFCDELLDEKYNILYTHGTRLTKTTIKDKCLKEQHSIICGHWHHNSLITYHTNRLFTAFTGCGIDETMSAFDYSRGSANKAILSAIVISKGVPTIYTL